MWEALGVAVAIITAGAGAMIIIGRMAESYVIHPIKETANEALNMAVENRRSHEELMNHLVGTDAPTDEGILREHSAKLEAIGEKLDQSRRLETEQTYIFQEILKQIEGIEIEETDDGYTLRGDGEPDGGVEIHHDYK